MDDMTDFGTLMTNFSSTLYFLLQFYGYHRCGFSYSLLQFVERVCHDVGRQDRVNAYVACLIRCILKGVSFMLIHRFSNGPIYYISSHCVYT